jgi:hypothetical protein
MGPRRGGPPVGDRDGVITMWDMWRVWVTDDDIRRATDAWLAAVDSGAPTDRVDDLREELDRLWRAGAYQLAASARASA